MQQQQQQQQAQAAHEGVRIGGPLLLLDQGEVGSAIAGERARRVRLQAAVGMRTPMERLPRGLYLLVLLLLLLGCFCMVLHPASAYPCGWTPPNGYTGGTGCLYPPWTWCNLWCQTPSYSGRARHGGGPCGPAYGPSGTTCTTCMGGNLIAESCYPLGCTMGNPANGNAGSCGSVGSNTCCNINCNSGYVVSGGARCCSGTSWTNTPTCQPAPCIGENIAQANGGCLGRVVAHGSTCSYTCNTGYTPINVGSTSTVTPRKCSLGNFDHRQYCMPKRCFNHALPNLEATNDPMGVTVTGKGTIGSCADVASGGDCQLACPGGYTITSTRPTCSLGTWSATVVTCQAKDCPTTAPKDGTLGTCPSTIQSGTSCNYKCNAPGSPGTLYNYRLAQDQTTVTGLHCFLGKIYKKGVPSPFLPSTQWCDPIECELPAPRNGGFGTCQSNPTPSNALVTTTTTCTHECNAGYLLMGTPYKCYATVITNSVKQTCRSMNPNLMQFALYKRGTTTVEPFAPAFVPGNNFPTTFNSNPLVYGATSYAAGTMNQIPWEDDTVTIAAKVVYGAGHANAEFGGSYLYYKVGASGSWNYLPDTTWTAGSAAVRTPQLAIPVTQETTPVAIQVTTEAVRNNGGNLYTKTYTIYLHRKSNVATLASLTINPPGLSTPIQAQWYTPGFVSASPLANSILRPWAPAWDPETMTYYVAMANQFSSVVVTAVWGYSLQTASYSWVAGSSTGTAPNTAIGSKLWTNGAVQTTVTPSLTLAVGNNTFTHTQVSEDTGVSRQERTYRIVIHRISNDPRMSNVYLQPTGLTGLTPAFSPDSQGPYRMTVQASTDFITVFAEQVYSLGSTWTGQAASFVNINSFGWNHMLSGATSQQYPLQIGDNWIGVKGLAEDFVTTQLYVFLVHRLSPEPRLATLQIKYGASALPFLPAFNRDTASYYMRNTQAVKTNVPAITFVATPVYPLSSIRFQWNTAPVAGIAYVSGSTSPAQSLIMGDQLLTVTVTSEDNNNVMSYTVAIHKISNDATLDTLNIEPLGGGLQQDWDPDNRMIYDMIADPLGNNIDFTSVTRSSYATQRYKVGSAAWGASRASTWTETFANVPMDSTTTVAISVLAEDKLTSKIYQIRVTKEANNAQLKSLTSPNAVVSPKFDNQTYAYTSTVRSSLQNFRFTPTPMSPAATIKYTVDAGTNVSIANGALSGYVQLKEGPTVFSIIAESQDRTRTRTYTWTIYRSSNDSLLDSLATNPAGAGLVPAFSRTTFNYRLTVPPHSGPLVLLSTPRHPQAIQFRCLGAQAKSTNCVQYGFAPTESVGTPLVEGGDFNVTVRVQAEERDSSSNYTILVHTVSDDALLKALTVSNNPSPTLTPVFRNSTLAYKIYVAAGVSSVSLFPIPNNPISTLQYSLEGAPWTASGMNHALQTSGNTTIRILVTAESGATQTYTVMVDRASNDCVGQSLAIVPGGTDWSPTYSPSEHLYSVRVDPTISSIALQAKPANQFATQFACLKGHPCTASFPHGGVSASVSLVDGDNLLTWKVVSQDSVNTCTTNVTVHKVSSSSLLHSLASTVVSGFASLTFDYIVVVNNATDRTAFIPVPVSPWATLRWSKDGGLSWAPLTHSIPTSDVLLQQGANSVWFEVTSEDQDSISVYRVSVTRTETQPCISNLVFEPAGTGLDPTFDAATTIYSIRYASTVTSVKFQSQLCSATATQKYTFRGGAWINKANDAAFTTLPPLLVGDNVLRVAVTAGDGITQANYTITLRRLSADTSLASLLAAPGSLIPGFVSALPTNNYLLNVLASVSSVSLTPTPSYPFATLEYSLDGFAFQPTASGAALNSGGGGGGALDVVSGETTTVFIRVTAEETSRTRTYKVDVRPADSSVGIQSLIPVPAGYGLAPAFDSVTFDYKLVLLPRTTSVQFQSTLASAFAKQVFCSPMPADCGSGEIASGDLSQSIATVLGGDVNVTLRVTAESGRVLETLVRVHVQSDDSALISLLSPIGVVGPSFNSSHLDYVLQVPAGVSNVPLFPTPRNSFATVEYQTGTSGSWGLTFNPSVSAPADGSDVVVSIRVTAEDGSQSVYTVTLHWVSDDARLTALAVSNAAAGLVPSFNSFIPQYRVTLRYAESSGVVSWISSSARSTVSVGVNAAADLSVKLPSASQTELLNWGVGDNIVNVVNVAENGVSQTAYQLTLHRKSADATLALLRCETTELTPGFEPLTLNYTAPVITMYRTAFVYCVAQPNHTAAAVEYRLTAGTSSGGGLWKPVSDDGQFQSSALALNFGDNLFEARVTSEDGNTLIYTVGLYVASNDATLFSLSTDLAFPLLDPSFDRDVTTYSMVLESTQRNMTVTAVKNHPKATHVWTLFEIDGFNPYNTHSMPLGDKLSFPGSDQTSALSLQEGDSYVEIEVNSEDHTVTTTYTLNVHVKSSNTKVDDVKCTVCGPGGTDNTDTGNLPIVPGPGTGGPHTNVTWGLWPPFDPDVPGEYNITVPSGTDEIPLYLFPQSPSSKLNYSLNGGPSVEPASGTSVYDVLVTAGPLKYGDNILVIDVTSEDGSNKKTFVFHIYRLSPFWQLVDIDLTPDADSRTPAVLDSDQTLSFVLRSSADKADLLVTPQSPTLAWISIWMNDNSFIDGVKQPDGRWLFANLSLEVGNSNSFILLPEAEDGTGGTDHAYYVTVKRLDNFCDISAIASNTAYALTPDFDPTVHDYAILLPNEQGPVSFQVGLPYLQYARRTAYANVTVERVAVPDAELLAASSSLAADAWVHNVTIVQPGVLMHFDVQAEDYRVVCRYNVHATRTPWKLTNDDPNGSGSGDGSGGGGGSGSYGLPGWPSEMWVGETRDVSLVPDFEGQSFVPLDLSFALSLPTAQLTPSSVTLVNVDPVRFQLNAPTVNRDDVLMVTPSVGNPNPLGYAAPPVHDIVIHKASWEVSPLPDRLYPNQVVPMTLTPNKGDARGIGLTLRFLHNLTGVDATPPAVLTAMRLGPDEYNFTISVDVTMPSVTGPFRMVWHATNFIDPNTQTAIVLAPAQMILTGVAANDTDVTWMPRPTQLNVMYGRVARISVLPMARPLNGSLVLNIASPSGTKLEPNTLTWPEGNSTAKSFYFSFGASALVGNITFSLGGEDAPHFLPPPALSVLQYSQCSAVPPPCVNSLQCTDMPSTVYATSYTCVCKFGWSGANCEVQDNHPPPTVDATAAIAPIAPVSNPNCGTILLDGTASYGLGVGTSNDAAWQWSLVAVNSSTGDSLVVPGTLQTNRTSTGFLFRFKHAVSSAVISINATSYANYTGLAVLTFRANQLVPARYAFQLIVQGTYQTSPAALAVLDSTGVPAPQIPYTPDPLLPADWMPSLAMHIPEPVRRTVQNMFTLDLIPSACAPVPDPQSAMYYYSWVLTPVGPADSSSSSSSSSNSSAVNFASAMSLIRGAKLVTDVKNLIVPSSTLVANWRYKINATLTITTFNRINTRRRLLTSGAAAGSTTGVATVTSSFVVGRSPLLAAISGASERRMVPSSPVVFDASPSLDPDDPLTPLSFRWKCFKGDAEATGYFGSLPACVVDSGVASYTQSQLVVSPNTLQQMTTYHFQVQVESPDGRTATAAATLFTGEENLLVPIVTIRDLPSIGGQYWLSPNATLRLQARALSLSTPPTPENEMVWKWWSVFSGAWNTASQQDVDLTAAGVLSSPLASSSLVMNPAGLRPETKYSAQIVACEPQRLDTPDLCGLATVQFAFASPPAGGVCQLIPQFGQALSTVFIVTCGGWSDPMQQFPLQYTAKYRTPQPAGPGMEPPAGQLRTLTTAGTVPRMEFLLPAGEIVVEVHITNAYGATTVWSDVAYVADLLLPPCDAAKFLTTGYDSMLYTVLYTRDRDRTMQMLGMISDMVLTAQCDCALPDTQFVQKQLVLSLAVALGFVVSFDDLTTVTPPKPDADLIQMSGTVLAGISRCPACANEEVWQMLAGSLDLSLKSLPAASPYIDAAKANPWVGTFDQALFFTQAQTTLNSMQGCQCDHLAQLKEMQKELLLARAAATLPYEPPMTLGAAAEGALSTVVVTGLNDPVGVSSSGGVTVNLPSSSASQNQAQYGTQNDPASFQTAAGAGSANSVTTTVIQYPPSWTDCRSSTLPPGTKLGSDLFDIDFSLDGDDFNAGKVEFNIPISDDVASTIGTGDSACTPWQQPVCAFVNDTTRLFSSAGCVFVGLEYGPSTTLPDGSVVRGKPSARCQCNHTTEFAILLQETETANACAAAIMGPWWYAIFMVLYACIALLAAWQSYRVHRASKWTHWLPLTQHLLIVGVGVTRGFSMGMFWALREVFPLSAQAFVSALPYLFYPWVFTLLIFCWAAVTSASSRSTKQLTANPILQYRMFLYSVNAVITVSLLGIFAAMAGSTAEADRARMATLASAGNVVVGVVSFLFSLFLLYYGVRLTWTAHFAVRKAGRRLNPVAKRVLGYSFSLFVCFAGAAMSLLAGEVDSSVNEGDRSSIAYFALDVAAYAIVLLMMRSTVAACLVKPSAAKFLARGRKASWMTNNGEGDEYDDDWEDASSTSRSTSSSASSSNSSSIGGLDKPLRTHSISGKVRFGSNAIAPIDDALQHAAAAEGGVPLTGFEDGEVCDCGGGSWTLMEDPTEPVGKHDIVKDVEMFDENGKSFVPALFKRFIKRQTAAQAEAEARSAAAAAAAAAAAVGWQIYADFSEPIRPNDDVKAMEVFDSSGRRFSPPVFKKFVKRGVEQWELLDESSSPLRLGDEVRQVEVLDANGNSFEPKQFRKEVWRAQNTWKMVDLDFLDSPQREGPQTVRDIELYDEKGNSYEPKRFAKCVRVDETTVTSPSASSAPGTPRDGGKGWQLFEEHSEPLQPGDQLQAVELLDRHGKSFEPALFRRMVKRAAADASAGGSSSSRSSTSSSNSNQLNAKVQAKLGHGWQIFFDPGEKARPEDRTVLVEQLDPNGKSFTPACFKRVIKRKAVVPSPVQTPSRLRGARPLLPAAASAAAAAAAAAPAVVREPTVPAGKDHAWVVILDDGSEEASSVPAGEIVTVEQWDENGLPYNPAVFKRFVRKPLQGTLPPIEFKGSTVLYHLNKMKAAGSVTATKPGVPLSPPLPPPVEEVVVPNTVNQLPVSPLLSSSPELESDVIQPTPRSGSSSSSGGAASATEVLPRERTRVNAMLVGPGLRDAMVNQTFGQFTDGSPMLLPAAAAAAAAAASIEPSATHYSYTGEEDDDDVSGTYTGSSSGSEDDDESEFSETPSKTTTSVSQRASKHHLKRIVSATLEAAAAKAEALHASAAASERAVQSALANMRIDDKAKRSAAEAQRAAERAFVQNQMNSAAADEEEERRLASLRAGSLLSPSLRAASLQSPSLRAAGIDDDEVEFAIESPQHRPAAARRRAATNANRAVASSAAAAAFLKGVTAAAAASSKSPSGARVSPAAGAYSSPGGARTDAAAAAASRVPPMSPAPSMSVPALSGQVLPPPASLDGTTSRPRGAARGTASGSAAATAAAAALGASPNKGPMARK